LPAKLTAGGAAGAALAVGLLGVDEQAAANVATAATSTTRNVFMSLLEFLIS
jgi:hypothetical protein